LTDTLGQQRAHLLEDASDYLARAADDLAGFANGLLLLPARTSPVGPLSVEGCQPLAILEEPCSAVLPWGSFVGR
jgi:hypothetical protein